MKIRIDGKQSIWIVPYLICAIVAGTAATLDVYKLRTCLRLQYDVINHNPAYLHRPTPFAPPAPVHSFYARIFLQNTCDTTIPNDGWSLVFCHKTLIEYLYFDFLRGDYRVNNQMVNLTRGNMTLKHILGDTYSLTPNRTLFKPLKKNQAVNIIFHAKDESVSRYDVCLNWYINNGTHSAVIPNTPNPDRLFVPSFNTIFKNTRNPPNDYVVPATPGFRFDMHRRNQTGHVIKLPTYQVKDMDILPIPLQQTTQPGAKKIPFKVQDWAVTIEDRSLDALKKYLEEVLPMLKKTPTANTNRIILKLRKVPANSQPEPEKYNLKVTAKSAMTPYSKVEIEGDDMAGVFYGIQSLLATLPASPDGSIQETDISDKPRYPYRGLRFDVASNFFPKETIFKLLKIMARLKMNKLQLIIANDYGVRVEIEGYEELSTVAGRRCHDLTETRCLMSQLGSDPNANAGIYTKQDYTDILKEAAKHHIEIIPEYKFDDEMRATAKAMAVYEKNRQLAAWANLAYQPFKPNLLREGRMNPCHGTTTNFFDAILGVFKKYHNLAGVPLKTFGIGGNFYSVEPWLVTCAPNYHPMNPASPKHPYVDIKAEITTKLMNISEAHNVDLIGFEEYFLAFPTVCRRDCAANQYTPFNTSRYDMRTPYTIHRNPSSFIGVPILEKHPDNVTDSVEERHTRYMQFKALGYKSIFSPDDALSLHNKDEHDPDIPGNIGSLAPPITNYGIHQLLPDGACCNSYYCHPKTVCDDTAAGVDFKPDGMQAKMFTEKIVSEKHLMELLFPRLIWAANKMWHKADWEDSYVQPTVGANGQLQVTNLANVKAKNDEFLKINTIISEKWLKILDDLNIFARITPPGIFFNASWPKHVDYYTALPGLILQVWQVDNLNRNGTWVDLKDAAPLQALVPRGYYFRLRAPYAKGRIDGARGYSKPVLAYTNAQGNLYMNEIRQKMEELRVTNQIIFPIQHFAPLSDEGGITAFRIMCNIPVTNGPPRPCGLFANQTPRQPNGTQNPGGQINGGQIPNQQVPNAGTQNTRFQTTGQRNWSRNPNNQASNTAVRGGIPTRVAGSSLNSQTVG